MKNIIETFQKHVRQTPHKNAIIFEDYTYTYRQVEENIKQLSIYLESLNIQEGSHLILLLNNSYEYLLCMLSLANLGAVLIPLNTTLKIEVLNKAIASTDATYILTDTSLKNKLIDTQSCSINSANILALECDLNAIDTSGYLLNKANISADNDYILTMTSGSTGDPKPIVFTQKTKINRSLLAAKDLYELKSDEVVITASPLYHSLGQRLLLLPLLIGGTSVLLRKFTPKFWIEAVKKNRVTFTIAIASHLEVLVEQIKESSDLDSLRTIVSSSSLLKVETKKRCIEKFNCDFHECYGASEVGILTNLTPDDSKRCISSVGKALAFVDLKIVDENKNEVQNGTIGEIISKTPTAFSRYYKNEKKTKQSTIDGYFYTGDLGYLDENGYLYLSGRKKDIIIVGGVNVYPLDIENVISEVKGVQECSVIGVDDSYFGEAILAVLSVDEAHFNLKDVKVTCIKRLADYQVPMAFELVDELPKNSLGKIMKHELRAMFKNYDATALLRKVMRVEKEE